MQIRMIILVLVTVIKAWYEPDLPHTNRGAK
jgi:hypothetical protein